MTTCVPKLDSPYPPTDNDDENDITEVPDPEGDAIGHSMLSNTGHDPTMTISEPKLDSDSLDSPYLPTDNDSGMTTAVNPESQFPALFSNVGYNASIDIAKPDADAISSSEEVGATTETEVTSHENSVELVIGPSNTDPPVLPNITPEQMKLVIASAFAALSKPEAGEPIVQEELPKTQHKSTIERPPSNAPAKCKRQPNVDNAKPAKKKTKTVTSSPLAEAEKRSSVRCVPACILISYEFKLTL